MVEDLCLQLLDVACRDRSVLNDTVCFLYQPLEVSHFLFILLILHHCLLDESQTLLCKC